MSSNLRTVTSTESQFELVLHFQFGQQSSSLNSIKEARAQHESGLKI